MGLCLLGDGVGRGKVSLIHLRSKRESRPREEGGGGEFAPLSGCYEKGCAAVLRVTARYSHNTAFL